MDPDFWHHRWNTHQTAFHESTVNPLLASHWDRLSLAPGSRVMVPLCGKTRDIPWLLSRGYRVAGVELSPLAVEQLFADLGVMPEKQPVGGLMHYRAEGIDIFAGDVFALSREMLGPVEAVYDRAALVALPEEMRRRYAAHLSAITGQAPQLLICYEYDQSLQDGPPFSVTGEEVAGLYGRDYALTFLASSEVAGGLRGRCPATEKVWLLQGRQDPPAASTRTATPVRWTLAGLALSMLLSSLGTSSANVALPALAQAFQASFQAAQWIVLAYLLAITTLIISVGRLGDRAGRKRLLLAGLALFTTASVLCGAASTLGLLIAARALQGLGAAVMMALTMAFVGDAVPRAKAGTAMGLLGTMSAVGTALGPTVGGMLLAGPGWRTIFLLNVPLGILAVLLAHRYLPADRQEPKAERAGFDLPGTLLLGLTLAAYALAMTLGHGHFGGLNAALLLAAAVGLGLFLRAETRVRAPLIPLPLFRDPTLSAGLAMSALVSTVVMPTLVVGPFYLSHSLGLNAAAVGLVVSAGPVVAALTAAPAGRAVDRFGARRMTLIGLVEMALGCLLLFLLPATAGIPGYVVPLVVITAGYALFQTANNTSVMADVPAGQRGVTSAMLNLSRNLGLLTGAAAMGAVFAFASGTSDPATARAGAVATGMQHTFGVAGVLTLAAIAIATLGSRSRTALPLLPLTSNQSH